MKAAGRLPTLPFLCMNSMNTVGNAVAGGRFAVVAIYAGYRPVAVGTRLWAIRAFMTMNIIAGPVAGLGDGLVSLLFNAACGIQQPKTAPLLIHGTGLHRLV